MHGKSCERTYESGTDNYMCSGPILEKATTTALFPINLKGTHVWKQLRVASPRVGAQQNNKHSHLGHIATVEWPLHSHLHHIFTAGSCSRQPLQGKSTGSSNHMGVVLVVSHCQQRCG
jgi:hypothetical protein